MKRSTQTYIMAKNLQRLVDAMQIYTHFMAKINKDNNTTKSYICFMVKVYKDWVIEHKAIPNSWQKSTKTEGENTKLYPIHGKSLQRLDDDTQSYTCFMTKVYKDWMIQHRVTHFMKGLHKPIPISWQKVYKDWMIQHRFTHFMKKSTQTYTHFMAKSLQRLDDSTQVHTFHEKVYTNPIPISWQKVYKDWMIQHRFTHFMKRSTQTYTNFMAKSLQRLDDSTQVHTFHEKVYTNLYPFHGKKSTKTGSFNTGSHIS